MANQQDPETTFNPFDGDPNTMAQRVREHIDAEFAKIDEEGANEIARLREEYLAQIKVLEEQWKEKQAEHAAKMQQLEAKSVEIEQSKQCLIQQESDLRELEEALTVWANSIGTDEEQQNKAKFEELDQAYETRWAEKE